MTGTRSKISASEPSSIHLYLLRSISVEIETNILPGTLQFKDFIDLINHLLISRLIVENGTNWVFTRDSSLSINVSRGNCDAKLQGAWE